jgi:hypothetical protein
MGLAMFIFAIFCELVQKYKIIIDCAKRGMKKKEFNVFFRTFF